MNQQSNFNTMVDEMQEQIQDDSKIFKVDEANRNRIHLIDPQALLNRTPTDAEILMMQSIANVDNYSWNKGELGGLDTGFSSFNESIEGGLQTGLILFAASPNVGKSAFMLQLMKQVAESNEDVYCEYHSLDDGLNHIMPRWVASDQLITIGQANNPEKYAEESEVMEKRNEGFKNLYKMVDKFKMYDGDSTPQSVEELEDHIKRIRMLVGEETKIVLGMDSFYDLKTSGSFGGNDRGKHDYIAEFLKALTDRYDVIIMCTAHLRKVNNRRPINDDLKESNRLEFEANLICMLHNDVGINEESADIYWHSEEEDLKMPVLEMRFAKNKFSAYKGTRFFEFIPNKSYFLESSDEASRRYATLVYQS